jgi:hypothetical protein
MYHVELRQFPHNFRRFNLTEAELRETILEAWARGDWVDLGERKWSPHQAKLTVLEGPQLPVEQLSMGRGWRNAARHGHDVTERLITATTTIANASDFAQREQIASPAPNMANRRLRVEPGAEREGETRTDSASELRLMADSLGLEVLAKLSSGPVRLAMIWSLARRRCPERSASDCLKLAEHAIHSLLQARLGVMLLPAGHGENAPCASDEQIARILRALESWSDDERTASTLIRVGWASEHDQT